MKRFPSLSFSAMANMSITQTLARSINTSLTVLLPLLAIALLGGESIRTFAITLLIGIAVGTYSSIFVATPLLDWWQAKKWHFRWPKLQIPRLQRRNNKTRASAV
jgi:preprotein translocase subunit SecF